MADELKSFLEQVREQMSFSGKPTRLLVLGLLLFISAALLLWIFDRLFIFFLARSYVGDIALVFSLNEHLAQAIALAVFAIGVFFISRLFSFSKFNRLVGSIGLVALLVIHSLFLWHGTKEQRFDPAGRPIKCYVLLREGKIIYLERQYIDRIDPDTGQICRAVTPEMAERLDQYAQGKRPERIRDDEPTQFFDVRTGQPLVWFWRSKSGTIELFNLMGFHPESGQELVPVTKEIVDEYKQQLQQKKRVEERRLHPPHPIDPKNAEWFDPTTGEAQVWFWRGQFAQWEFFDGPGFHPGTGRPLKLVTTQDIEAWKTETVQNEARQKKDEERREQERLRHEKEERERAEREEQRLQDELRREERENQSGVLCDQVAGNPTDSRKPREVAGVSFDELKMRAAEALDICRIAVNRFRDELRYQYEYARALSFLDPDKATKIFRELARRKYPAAFDNLGSLILQQKGRNSIRDAIRIFMEGVQLGDPDSMVSLAGLIERGFVSLANPVGARYALLSRAAAAGHRGAGAAVEQLNVELQQQQQERFTQQQQERLFLDMMGTILSGAIGHH